MAFIKDYLQRNWLNYLLFFGLLLTSLQLARLTVELALFLKILPFILLLLGLVLAVLFNKSKLFFTLILTAATLLVLYTRQTENRFFDLLFFSTGLLVPLNTLIFANTQEKGIFSAAGKFKMIVIGLQTALVAYCLLFQEAWLSLLKSQAIFPAALQRSLVPDDLVAVLFILCLMVFILRDFFKRDSNQSVQFFSLSALFMAFLKPNDVLWYSLFLSGSGLFHLLTLIKKSYTMAYLDDLTGIPGRRALNEDLQKLSGLFTLAMVDIDHFKQFNDKHGHDVGDEALRHVARSIKRAVRGGRAYRFGGEEFTIIYPGRDTAHALINLEEIRRKVETEPLVSRPSSGKVSGGKKLLLTISLGLAENDVDSRPSEVLRLADKALYRAKEKGRNQVSR